MANYLDNIKIKEGNLTSDSLEIIVKEIVERSRDVKNKYKEKQGKFLPSNAIKSITTKVIREVEVIYDKIFISRYPLLERLKIRLRTAYPPPQIDGFTVRDILQKINLDYVMFSYSSSRTFENYFNTKPLAYTYDIIAEYAIIIIQTKKMIISTVIKNKHARRISNINAIKMIEDIQNRKPAIYLPKKIIEEIKMKEMVKQL